MENIKNPQLNAALNRFLAHQNKDTFTFGAPENNSENNFKLSQSDVNYLFDELIEHKEKLYNLYLNGTEITEIPSSIGQLSNLNLLSLIYNKIESLPKEVCNLEKLQILSLSNNEITKLPESIGDLKNLTHIDLRDNEGIANLPNSIIDLHNLRELNLMKTGITIKHKNKIEQLKQLCINASKSDNDTVVTYTRKGLTFYKNPKIYIDGIGLLRTENKNVLSKNDFDNIMIDIDNQPPTKQNTKSNNRKTLTTTRRSPSPSPRRTKKSKTPSPPRKSPSPRRTKKIKKTPTP